MLVCMKLDFFSMVGETQDTYMPLLTYIADSLGLRSMPTPAVVRTCEQFTAHFRPHQVPPIMDHDDQPRFDGLGDLLSNMFIVPDNLCF